jgi:hypothetical protein
MSDSSATGRCCQLMFMVNAMQTGTGRPSTSVGSKIYCSMASTMVELGPRRGELDLPHGPHSPDLPVLADQNLHTGRERLRLAVPATVTLLERLAARGESLRVHTHRVLALLDDYGAAELSIAVAIALERDALGAGSLAHILDTRRRQRGQRPPLPVVLPDRPGVRDRESGLRSRSCSA